MEGGLAVCTAQPQQRQPLVSQLPLAIGYRLVNADRIEKTGQDHVAHAGADAVIQMQTAADVADMAFDIPDGFPAAAPPAEQGKIVTVPLRVIAGDQAEQRRFTGAVRADDLPVFAGINLPVKVIGIGRSL